ncbi:hypothetical protein CLAFUW4_00958 [Fulvia fulva]|uniref:Uncharacterized protein n=1 Tax=Passalora fulva TaxID=5499 RepID=A0A9Q8L8U4_PASFU|nr:uncharacterized protein CLAFUR5_00964 [Fulvia fulva]KAK4635666.1 hypothetical protein CLAFUR4_00959 [Fulvia fulva]KAK4636394.1 hypothetical protein CLAFUR0_00960 [Fulvia fulva]UJO12896.1 hypothetical protein CLAFUR5_00964 [Fulvia fulva]WPV08484.1 hypothetical protein CLAFUW4_00958 [Fulvia fulva]WPV23978.1 hypothetical protein CLAFUW7_00858 [Fulvia fulva]
MSYNQQRHEMLRKLQIEQLPTLYAPTEMEEHYHPFGESLPIRSKMPVPGKRCPNCLRRGQTIWVIPGKRCSQCGTEVL